MSKEKFWEEWDDSSPLCDKDKGLKDRLSSYVADKGRYERNRISYKEQYIKRVDPNVALFIGSFLGNFYKKRYLWNKRTRKLYIRSSLDSNRWLLVACLQSPLSVWENLSRLVKKIRGSQLDKFKGWYKNGD